MAKAGPLVTSTAELFAGPGESRRLCRETDWSATPVGPPSTWSPVLRSTVQLVLASGFPILINWGSEMIAIYNDAFAPLMGRKHPESWVQAAKDTWSEAWTSVGSRLDDVLLRGRTLGFTNERQILERNGYPEECYFTFSHSPIRDADGTILGVFTASTETTLEVLNKRRMRAVRELGALSTAGTPTMVQTCQAVLDVLERTRESIPFAAIYLAVPGDAADLSARADVAEPAVHGNTAEIVAAYGFTVDTSEADDAMQSPAVGSIDRVIRSGEPEVVRGLRERLPGLLEPGPLGPLIPDEAVVLPLTVIGSADPVGALVLGVNPYRPIDEDLRSFFSLLARQIRTTLTDAVTYETERHRGQMLAELDEAKVAFFQNVSHELRTPLTLLLSPLHDLLDRSESETGVSLVDDQESLRAALRAAERLRLMVDALLDFSGAEARIIAPDRQPTDLGELTSDVASMFRSTTELAGLRLDVHVPSEPVIAMMDGTMWSTIVTNLLSNAMKFTHDGIVTVRLEASAGRAVLTVADTGSGIDPDDQPLVFDRFHRGSGGESGGGAGIGLALVADLVHAQLGVIELASAPGSGSTFTVTMPIDADDRRASTGIERLAGDCVSVGSALPRLLLVEDDTDLRDYLSRLLARDGWEVTAVSDAEAAIAVMRGTTGPAIDLVLTDLVLPGNDGLHLVSELRRLDRSKRLPLIVLTARGGVEAIAHGMAAGADDYITKPFVSQELLARLRANYELHRLREEAVVLAEDKTEQIRGGLQSNRVIGTAIGIVMTTHRLTAAQGFALLVAASQHTNRKLRELAADVASTGRLPLRPTLSDELLVKITGAG